MFKRALLLVLGIGAAVNGGVMLVKPDFWYTAVPGVQHTGPFNAHFVLDIGIAFLVAGAGLLLGAWTPRFWPAAATGAAFLGLHGALHLAELIGGHTHGPVAFEVAAVLLPSALALYAAWPEEAWRRAS